MHTAISSDKQSRMQYAPRRRLPQSIAVESVGRSLASGLVCGFPTTSCK